MLNRAETIMIIQLKYFGLVADITKKNEEQFHIESEVNSLHLVQSKIEEHYPEIRNTTYSFAVNQSLTKEDIVINEGDEIALLPPFAGG
jgi:molybdopterin converting factor subunit 1